MNKNTLLKIFFSLSILILLISCSEETDPGDVSVMPEEPEQTDDEEEAEDDETPITYFSYVAPANIGDVNTEAWIMLYDDKGTLLDYSKYIAGQQLDFEMPKIVLDTISELSFTNLVYNSFETGEQAQLRSFTGIEKESFWNNNTTIDNKGNITKTKVNKPKELYTISVDNVPGVDKFSIYSETALIATAGFNLNEITNTFQRNNVELSTDASYLFFIGDLEDGLKYIIFNPPTDSNDIMLDYEDFSDYDSILITDLPPNTYLFTVSRGRSEWNSGIFGVEKSLELRFDSPSQSKIGYIDNFASVSTVFEIRLLDNYDYYVEKHGEKPEQINILSKPFFEVIDSTLNNFSFETDLSFKRKIVQWSSEESEGNNYSISINWFINGDDSLVSSNIGKVPEEIMELYPNLDFTEVSLEKTFLYTKSESYPDFLMRMGLNGNEQQIQYPETLEFLRLY